MRKLYLITQAVFLTLFVTLSAIAQEKTITGTVTAFEDGNPIPGVNVVVKGTTTGTATDLNGKYSISVAEGVTLVFSSVGYTNEEVVVAGQTSIDVKMVLNVSSLSEVVVVGYGTQERRDVTGAISSVKSTALKNNPVNSFDAALQGRTAGVQVQQSTGIPGSAIRVRVRGTASIGGSADPLYVVDGVPLNTDQTSDPNAPTSAVNTNPLSSINPNDIESIEVLKDAAAAAIYGSRGANGVVLITTKRGKSGKTAFDLSYMTGVSSATHKLKMLSGSEWMQLYNEARVNDGLAPLGPNQDFTINGVTMTPNTIANTNWIDEVLQTGSYQDVNLSAKGGSEKTKFFANGSYNRNEGMLKGNTFERLSGRLNVDNQASERVSIEGGVGITYTRSKMPKTSYNGGIGAAQSGALNIWPVYNADGSYFGTQLANPATWFNPIAQLEDKYTTHNYRTLGNMKASYKILPELVLSSQGSIDLLTQIEDNYYSPVNRYYNNRPLGASSERRLTNVNLYWSSMLSYNKTFNEVHNISAVVAYDVQNFSNRVAGYYPQGFAGFANSAFTTGSANNLVAEWAATADKANSPTVGYSYLNRYGFISYVSRVNYKYNDRYLLGLSFRSDGSSNFGPDHRFGYFPAASAGWIMTEEDFIKNIPAISFLKLRASYGATGNANIGNSQWFGSYSAGVGYGGSSGLYQTRLANDALTWEKNRQFDAGIDYGFLNNRISGTIGFYNKTSTALLLSYPVQTSSGFSSSVVNSDVVVKNTGIEFDIKSENLVGDFKWTTELNISSNRNRVTDVAGIAPDGFGASEGDTRVIKNQPIGISYLAKFAGVDPQTGLEMIYKVDANGNPTDEKIVATADAVQANRTALGRPFPKFTGGFTNRFAYKNFELEVLFAFSYGNQIYDDGAKVQIGGKLYEWNQRAELLDRWQQPGDITDVPKVTLNPLGGNGYSDNTSRFLYDASYMRLRNIKLSYNVPAAALKKAKVTSCQIFVAAQNWLTFTKYRGWDPEVVRYNSSSAGANIAFGAPYLPTPQAKTLTVGFNLGF
ncbi:TonB-linked outer membrane protein, SusC/RagA family [Flexibacter flexilis DSM 6793]|uniref:TonB-linked outer membrane protein, SusC/RagA family n=1 Tax=Flexibacter flexilis DSM 6793 TaxID=927664 RepID=A0A1I1GM03_9BACT|nr:TonB-dependent receptor [Flexibacter flexilis]SFC12282.1 TonB-linked outer membrane protein, SusC/RagA family [Flexibacter flexilis DSM 6793]